MTPNTVLHPAELVRGARKRQGLSQRRLALRAGTSQDAISRLERGVESPTFERLRTLLLVMGERLWLQPAPLEPGGKTKRASESGRLTPGERLYESASWNLAATRLERAGSEARRTRHPATRRAGG